MIDEAPERFSTVAEIEASAREVMRRNGLITVSEARAAVVQELRHMAAKLEEIDKKAMFDCSCWSDVSDLLWARADKLETEDA